MRRSTSGLVAALACGAGGCLCFSPGPIGDAYPRGARLAVVLFHVSPPQNRVSPEAEHDALESAGVPFAWLLRGEELLGPATHQPAVALDDAARVYAAFRTAFAAAAGPELVPDGAVRAAAGNAAALAWFSDGPGWPPAAGQQALPLESGDFLWLAPRDGGGGASWRPAALIASLPLFHLGGLRPAHGEPAPAPLARRLDADGFLMAAVVPVFEPGGTARTGPDRWVVSTSLRFYAAVTIFGRDGRRRYENFFRSGPVRLPRPPGAGPELERRTIDFARKLARRVRAEAIAG